LRSINSTSTAALKNVTIVDIRQGATRPDQSSASSRVAEASLRSPKSSTSRLSACGVLVALEALFSLS
jgi:hypothetical protein